MVALALSASWVSMVAMGLLAESASLGQGVVVRGGDEQGENVKSNVELSYGNWAAPRGGVPRECV